MPCHSGLWRAEMDVARVFAGPTLLQPDGQRGGLNIQERRGVRGRAGLGVACVWVPGTGRNLRCQLQAGLRKREPVAQMIGA
ncbi:hypothetical protein F751_4768 [Auxenochlorella protothecoides]|uniref:Uncharacterized protein n=1 Tax=Auxenochlorella protothecoides TaxID=3075 RepID=A0A087SKM1_AUXPR|nr:hypothetical protein F751_4768 [Auxenochlorella protothecoides]KFM26275.1 hypothetical protein F751_4768 [Auxenochlorella protothecoides]